MDTQKLLEILKIAWPLIALQLIIEVYALIDLLRRKETKTFPKPIWAGIIILGELLGSIIYLLFGRKDEE